MLVVILRFYYPGSSLEIRAVIKYLPLNSLFMSQDLRELKVAIASKLWRNKFFGDSYTTVENALSKIPQHDRGRGRDAIEEMTKFGLLEYHKNRKCVSISMQGINRVRKILRGVLPDFLLDSDSE